MEGLVPHFGGSETQFTRAVFNNPNTAPQPDADEGGARIGTGNTPTQPEEPLTGSSDAVEHTDVSDPE